MGFFDDLKKAGAEGRQNALQEMEQKKLNANRMSAGKYISGHPDVNEAVEEVKCDFANGEIELHDKAKKFASIAMDRVKDVSFNDASTMEKKLTATRLLTLGVFAFAAKKKTKNELYYVSIDWNDGRFDHSTVFEFDGKNANAEANTFRNAIMTQLRNIPEPVQ